MSFASKNSFCFLLHKSLMGCAHSAGTFETRKEAAARLWSKKNKVAREEVTKLVDDTYRKMQVYWASDLASKGQVSSDTSNLKVKGEREDLIERKSTTS